MDFFFSLIYDVLACHCLRELDLQNESCSVAKDWNPSCPRNLYFLLIYFMYQRGAGGDLPWLVHSPSSVCLLKGGSDANA